VDGSEFKPTGKPFKGKLKAKRGKGAKHRIQIRGTDAAGNTGPAATIKVRVIRKG
jgi:hypothetical protein